MSTALPTDISVTVSRALAEDIGDGDLTAALIPEHAQARGHVISREDAVLCGSAWFDEVFRQVDDRVRIHWETQDGSAVRRGGATNRRMGLYDGILIKENHIMAAGGIAAAVRNARAGGARVPVEVEVETLDQVREALEAGADILLLDNFDIQGMREAVKITAGRAKLEASGGIGIEAVRRVAETGVDYISVGALTKHVRAVDLSMRFEFEKH
jgi:nicotinate-nucleotide pyrophosphorylase